MSKAMIGWFCFTDCCSTMQFNNATVSSVKTETCQSPYLSTEVQLIVTQVSMAVHVGIIPILALWITLSNAIIIVAIWKSSAIPNPFTIITSSQAFSDLVTGALVLSLQVQVRIAYLTSGKVCQTENISIYRHVYRYFHWVSTLGTLINLAIFSADRFYAVRRPHRYRAVVKVSQVKRLLAAVWLFIFVFNIKTVYVLNIFLIIASILCIIVLQILILRSFRQHNASVATSAQGPSQLTLEQEKRAAKRIACLISVFCICTLPTAIFLIMIGSVAELRMKDLIGCWVTLIFYANSALNPFLYYWKNVFVKKSVKKLLKRN